MKSLPLLLTFSVLVFLFLGCKKDNNSPVVNNQSFSVNENTKSDEIVAQVLAMDPDGDKLKFSIPDEGEDFPFVFAEGSDVLRVKSPFVLDFEKQSKYVFRVEVLEQTKEQLSADAIITVNVLDLKEAPLFKDQSFTIKENLPKGALVGTLLFDKENKSQEVEFRVDAGNQNSAFAINQEGRLLINNAEEIDFEKTVEFKLNVRILDKSDDAVFASAIVTIVLEDQIESPNVKDQEFEIAENKNGLCSIGIINIKSKSLNQEFVFSIVEGNSNGFFFVGPQSGELFINQGVSFDYEKVKVYTIRVKVQDKQDASLYTNITVSINVTDQNEMPSIFDQTFSVTENSLNDYELGVIKATDPDAGQKLSFEIVQSSLEGVLKVDSETGSLRVNDTGKLDYESVKSIDLLVKATDNGDGTLSATANIRVNVLDVDERPVILTKKLQVEENSLSGFVIGKVDAQSYSGSPIEYVLVPSIGYEKFSIEKQTGNLVVNQLSALNYESQKSYSLIIKVYEKNNASVFRQETVVVDILDVNEAPVIANQQISIYETTDTGSIIGKVFATDPDFGQTLTYTVSQGNDDGFFAVDSRTGNVSLIKQVAVNSGEERSVPLTIRVQDNGGLWTEAELTVVVLKKIIPTSGLVAYFPFNGNANDESMNNHNSSVSGAVLCVDRNNRTNAAYQFDGVNDKITVNYSAGLQIRTISLWFYLNVDINGDNNYPLTLFAREGNYNNEQEFSASFIPSAWGTTGKLRFFYSIDKNNYYSVLSNSTHWVKDKWYHAVFMIHPTQGMLMYIDNVRQNSVGNYYSPTGYSNLSLYFGSWGTEPGRYFNGRIDDVVIYNRALSDSEINELFKM